MSYERLIAMQRQLSELAQLELEVAEEAKRRARRALEARDVTTATAMVQAFARTAKGMRDSIALQQQLADEVRKLELERRERRRRALGADRARRQALGADDTPAAATSTPTPPRRVH